MTSFAVQLKDFADRTNMRADMLVAYIVADIGRALVDRSPVGDPSYWKAPAPKDYTPGRFKGNWQIGINIQPAGETGRVDPEGAATQSAIVAAIPEHPAGTVIYLVNNVPYARPIEDGYSRQAPQGVVGLTAVEFQQFVDAAAQQAKAA